MVCIRAIRTHTKYDRALSSVTVVNYVTYRYVHISTVSWVTGEKPSKYPIYLEKLRFQE